MLDFTPLRKAVATLASALQETAVRKDDFGFRELRNTTSQAYDPDKAAQVFSGIPSFLVHAQLLLDHLKLLAGKSAHTSEKPAAK